MCALREDIKVGSMHVQSRGVRFLISFIYILTFEN